KDVSVNVAKISTVISVNNVSSIYKNTTLEAFIYDVDNHVLVNKNITLDINGVKYDAMSDDNGKVSFNLTSLSINNYSAKISFAGDKIYNNSFASLSVVINKIPTTIIAHDVKYNYGSTVLDVLIKDYLGNSLDKKNITLDIDGKNYSDIIYYNVKVIFNLKDLSPKNYGAIFKFVGDTVYDASSASVSIVVERDDTVIKVSNLSSRYGETVLDAYIYDNDNNPLANKSLNLIIGGNAYSAVSDSKGKVSFDLKNLSANNYIATVSFNGDVNYEGSQNSSSVVVNFVKSVIKVNNVAAEYGNVVLDAYIYDDNNKSLANKDIILSIAGNTYSIISDVDGRVRFNLSSILPDLYKVTVSFNGDDGYNKVETNASVVINK
ncbi:MAG: hypothetical protein Q4P14_02395, partial [Methanobacteriaceae archaeon]|nr:hypothetical protein [Methanobacteriaceae archaeon]